MAVYQYEVTNVSELTKCNYCSFKAMKETYTKSKITTKKNKTGGLDVYKDGEWIAWFMQLTDHCVC